MHNEGSENPKIRADYFARIEMDSRSTPQISDSAQYISNFYRDTNYYTNGVEVCMRSQLSQK